VEEPESLQELIRRRQAGGFVGRRAELGRFEENLGLPADRRRFLFSVHGDAGVGKSFLLRQFARIARAHDRHTALVDESVVDVPSAMEAIIGQLAEQGAPVRRYRKRFVTYRRYQEQLAADPAAPDGVGSLLTRSAVRVGVHAAGGVPVVGPFVKEVDAEAVAGQVDRLRTYLTGKIRNRDDLRLMLAPVAELSRAFTEDLRAASRTRPVVLFLDTYERTGAVLDPWLRTLIGGTDYGSLPSNLILTIGGQHPLDANTWGEYVGLRVDLPLQLFTEDEARELLAAKGVTDPEVVRVCLALSGRLPVLVALLAQARPGTVEEVPDPSDDAVARFLKWEPEPRRRRAALRGALPLELDAWLLRVADENADEDDFDWLCGLPFVSAQAQGFRYHDVVRDAMLRVQRRHSATGWQRAQLALAEHHRAARDALEPRDRAAWQEERFQHSALREHYHRLCADPAAALPGALAALVDTVDKHPAAARRWAAMIGQAGRDADDGELRAEGERLLGLVGAGDTVGMDLLDRLVVVPGLDREHRALVHGERGLLHAGAGRTDAALRELTRAIELCDTVVWFFAERADLRENQSQPREAIADYDRALALEPGSAWGINQRARIRRSLGELAEALEDHDRALRMEPDDSWLLANRGLTLRRLGRPQDALADYDRAIELDPEYAWPRCGRARLLCEVGSADEGLAEYDRAIELQPDYVFARASRADSLRMMGRREEALAGFDRAVEKAPTDAYAHYGRAVTLRELDRYEEALAELDRVVELDGPGIPTIRARALTLRRLGRLGEALAEYDRAVELEPGSGTVRDGRAETLRLLGRAEEALAEYDRVVELGGRDFWTVCSRALAARQLGRYQEALADYDRAVELGGTEDWLIGLRGEILLLLGRHHEAMAAFAAAVSPDTEDAVAYLTGLIAHVEGRPEDAREHFAEALRLVREAEHPDTEPGPEVSAAVYLLALGRPVEAETLVRARPPLARHAVRIREILYTLAELRRLTGRDVEPVTTILESVLAGA
jgi:tetratricopeptide (TPR) repeat protein